MLDTTNRIMMIKYIDRAIDDAHKQGYRLSLNTPLLDSFKKTVCPMGAVMLTRPNHPIHKEFMQVFMKAFDGYLHKEYGKEPVAHNLGLAYRRLLTR